MKKKLIIIVTSIVILGIGGVLLYPKLFPTRSERKVLYWTDPMIPGDRSDQPGKSPMGMERVPIYEDEQQMQSKSATAEQSSEYYTCPMHPSVKSDRQGACPVCGMALVKKSGKMESTQGELKLLGEVSLSPAQRVIANISTTKVKRQTLQKEINAVGIVDFAEPLLAKITARFRGRVEKLHVDFTGEVVKKGQPLFDLYSPDLVSAEQEFILALNAQSDVEAVLNDTASQQRLIRASKDRLRLTYGMTSGHIAIIESTRLALPTVTFYSPIEGTVTSKEIQEGQYVDEGTLLYQIADLSKVWAYLDIYEKDVRFLSLNQTVHMTTEAYPEKTFTGRITFIDPVLNAETRTVRIRTEFDNPQGKLKPQMWVKAHVALPTKNTLVIPTTAILATGRRNVVWIEVEENKFQPRNVVVGMQTETFTEVLKGLNEGESVVVTGGYLIDSESQLQQPAGTDASRGVSEHQDDASRQEEDNGEVKVLVEGKYSPNVIHATKGQKLRLNFTRNEKSKCTREVVFKGLNIRRDLPTGQSTIVEFTPEETGEILFECGMGMVHGKILVHE